MAMRLSGLMSGMDTDSLIQELVAARQTKVDKQKKAQTKLEWKQDAWKDLNTKLKNLQSKYINNMRFSTSYSKRTTKVSNQSVVSVITGENAVNGVQSLTVDKLAKTAYLTGAEVASAKGDVVATDKLSELTGYKGAGVINLTADGTSVDINVTAETTISDFLTQVKAAGLNASFDANNQRFFISAKKSGAESDFSFTASDENGAAALKALGLQTDISKDETLKAEYTKYAAYYNDNNGVEADVLAAMKSEIDETVASRVESYLKEYKSLIGTQDDINAKIKEIQDKYSAEPLQAASVYEAEITTHKEAIEKKKEELEAATDEDKKTALRKEIEELEGKVKTATEKKTDAESLATQQDNLAKTNEKLAAIEQYVDVTVTEKDGVKEYSAKETAKLTQEVNSSYFNKAKYAAEVMADTSLISGSGATKIKGEDAEITLNGAKFTGNDNVFEINGLTFTALSESKPGEEVTITTQDDVDGIYDMVKNFLKEYNTIINEMDKLYNADSAKGYEPLTDEEKEALSESEVEKYEKKIRDALLRNDSNLSSVSSSLREVMASGIEVEGKTMYLANFGIEMLGYFEAADNEKNAYHIAGDADDAASSGKADILKGMIASDPDTVVSFFTQMSQKLYTKMDSMSKSVDGYRTYGSFYDDKKMKSDYADYTTKIKELEDKLADYEDKWYKKFAAMETALAKMQSNTNALTGLLGG